jgi:hypothetical protein
MRRVHQQRAFLLALTGIAAVACGSSANKPAAQATQAVPTQPRTTQAASRTPAAPPSRAFTSRRYGFRVTLTKGWSGHDALVNWNGKKLQGLDSPAFANFTDPATGQSIAAAAARVAAGMGLAEWRAAMIRAAPAICSESPSATKTTLDGEPALAWTNTCSDGYNANKIAAAHGTRGYIILLASPAGISHAENRRTFDSIRRSFHFAR